MKMRKFRKYNIFQIEFENIKIELKIEKKKLNFKLL